MKRLILSLAAWGLLLGGVGQAKADTITITGIPGNNFGIWGPDGAPPVLNDPRVNQSFGQVFTVPTGDGVLDDYTLDGIRSQGGTFSFVSQIYAWNGNGTTGAPLFTSGVLTTTTTFTDYTFFPNIPVTAGNQYVALVTNDPGGVPLGGTQTADGQWNGTFSNVSYTGGPFATQNGDPGPANDPWTLLPSSYAAAFNADLSAVPEPATLTLLGLGCAGLATYRWRRRKRVMA